MKCLRRSFRRLASHLAATAILGILSVTPALHQAQAQSGRTVRAIVPTPPAGVNDLMARTRKLSLDLRPATLDHLGLLPALFMHFRRYTSQTEIRVDFKHSGVEGRRFGPDAETAAFRVVQEALTNVARHAAATAVRVTLAVDRNILSVEVRDDGQGLAPAAPGRKSYGLLGIRERAQTLGGTAEIASPSEGGTVVAISIPLARYRAAEGRP